MYGLLSGDKLNAFDPSSGKILRSIDVAAHAVENGLLYGQHLFQLAEDRIQKIDLKTGRGSSPPSRRPTAAVLTRVSRGLKGHSGSGIIESRKIHQATIPKQELFLRTIDRRIVSVTGVTWVDGEPLGMPPGKVKRAIMRRIDPPNGRGLGETRYAAWEWECRGLSPMEAINSSAGEGRAGR